jgi:hypothetical protein
MLSSLLGNPASPEVFLMVCILDLLPVRILCGYACKIYCLEPVAQNVETQCSQKFILNKMNELIYIYFLCCFRSENKVVHLMPHIPYDFVFRGVEHMMQSHCQLHHS